MTFAVSSKLGPCSLWVTQNLPSASVLSLPLTFQPERPLIPGHPETLESAGSKLLNWPTKQADC